MYKYISVIIVMLLYNQYIIFNVINNIMNGDNKTIPDNTLYILCSVCYYHAYVYISDKPPFDNIMKCKCGFNKI